MGNVDLRKLGAEELLELKAEVVRLKEQGKSGAEIEEMTGINKSAVSRVWQSYLKGGIAAITPEKRGRKNGQGMRLTDDESAALRAVLISKAPNQIKLPGYLWTLEKVSLYIRRYFDKDISTRGLSNYVRRWGLTCRKPSGFARTGDKVRLERFMRETYPGIAERARAENAALYWVNERWVGKRADERGADKRRVNTKAERSNMVSAITNQGHSLFLVYDESMNERHAIDFMRRLHKEENRKVFIVMYSLRGHRGRHATEWLKTHRHEVEVFSVPHYAKDFTIGEAIEGMED